MMKILTGAQIAELDQYTIENEPIDALQLIERAAEVMAQWCCNHVAQERPLCFFIGKGNNGADGLAVARMLHHAGYDCSVYTLFDVEQLSPACRSNLERLPRGIKVTSFDPLSGLTLRFDDDVMVVDAILGSGIRGALKGEVAEAIAWINAQQVEVIAIDLPSGLPTEFFDHSIERSAEKISVLSATTTLTLQFPKLSLLLPTTGVYGGEVVVLPIDLSEEFLVHAVSSFHYVDEALIHELRSPRAQFIHKGTYGHALLVCGSEGMVGAAVLATGAALRSGCGGVTTHLPRSERMVLYTLCPSATLSLDSEQFFSALPPFSDRWSAIGVGCGLGTHDQTVKAFERLMEWGRAMVIDADALNILSQHADLQNKIPPGSILTPHLGELRRLVGDWQDEASKLSLVQDFAARTACYIVVKGAYTMICSPNGRLYFNATGNPGMAKAGSGDVLTGLITGLLARGYAPGTAALLGVYFHGQAGDQAAEFHGREGMNSGDLIDFIQP